MKNKNLLLSVAFATSLMFAACSNKQDDIKPISNTDKLCTKNWKQTKYEKSADGTIFTNQSISDCFNDDFITFGTDGVYIQNRGSVKCDDNETQIKATVWSWGTSEIGVYIGEGASKKYANVITNDGSNLVLQLSTMIESKSGSLDSLIFEKYTYIKQ